LLHCAILLTLEGSTRFIYWANANEAFNPVIDVFYNSSILLAPNGTALAEKLTIQLGNLSTAYPFLASFVNSSDIGKNLTDLKHLGIFDAGGWGSGNSENDRLAKGIVFSLLKSLYSQINNLFNIKIDSSLADDSSAAHEMINNAYKDWYITFFVASGCVLIVLALSRYIGDNSTEERTTRENTDSVSSRKKANHLISCSGLIIQCLIGVALALVSLLALPRFDQIWSRFMNSPWIIPCVLLAFCLGMLKLSFAQPGWGTYH